MQQNSIPSPHSRLKIKPISIYNLNSREAIYAKVVEAYREKGKLIAALTTINKIISNTKIKLDFLNAVIAEQFILVSQAKGYYSHEEKEKLLNVINRIPHLRIKEEFLALIAQMIEMQASSEMPYLSSI